LNPAALEFMDASVVGEINRDRKMSLDERPMLFMEFHNVNAAALEGQSGWSRSCCGCTG
jgi:hypothetical protein